MAKPLSEHRLSKFRIVQQILCALVSFIVSVLLFLYVRSESETGLLQLSALVLANGFLILALWLIVANVVKLWQRPRILAYEKGLRYITRRGKQAWRWRQFTQLKTRGRRRLLGILPLAKPRDYDLYIKKKWVFSATPDYQRSGELSDLLELKTAEVLWPHYVAEFQAGRTLTFGKIKVNDTSIRRGKNKVSWSDVSGWEVKKGNLILHREGKDDPAQFRLLGVPNAHILLMTVESIASGVEHVQWKY